MSSVSEKDSTNTSVTDLGEFSYEVVGDSGLEFVIKDNFIENVFWRYRVRVFNGKKSGEMEMEMKVPWFS